MQPIQLISATAPGATETGTDMPKLRSDIMEALDGWTDISLNDRECPRGGVRSGQSRKSDNIRIPGVHPAHHLNLAL